MDPFSTAVMSIIIPVVLFLVFSGALSPAKKKTEGADLTKKTHTTTKV